jgi:hypothetical protein
MYHTYKISSDNPHWTLFMTSAKRILHFERKLRDVLNTKIVNIDNIVYKFIESCVMATGKYNSP